MTHHMTHSGYTLGDKGLLVKVDGNAELNQDSDGMDVLSTQVIIRGQSEVNY